MAFIGLLFNKSEILMLCAIPMEIATRELDRVLYLALHLAKCGLPTLFGERMVHEYLFRLNEERSVVYSD